MTKKKARDGHIDKTSDKINHKIKTKKNQEMYTCPICQNIIIIDSFSSNTQIITCEKCHTQALIEPVKENKKNEGLLYKALEKELQSSSYSCPYCKNIITLNDTPLYSFIITCPHCEKSALYDLGQKKISKTPRPLQKIILDDQTPRSVDSEMIAQVNKKWLYQPYIRARIIGLLLIFFGAGIYLYFSSPLYLKLGLSLILIGLIANILISEKRFMIPDSSLAESEELNVQQLKLLYSEKMTIIIALLIFAMFLITNAASIELFFILIYLGLLIIKELTDEMTPKHVRLRMNVFIVGFFILFILIIIKRITTIIS